MNLVEPTNSFPIFDPSEDRNLFSSGTPASEKVLWQTSPSNPKENVMRRRVMMVLASAALAGSLLASDARAGGGQGGGDSSNGASAPSNTQNQAAPAFQSGDLVRLRSGGPMMTVKGVKGDHVDCFWADYNGQFNSDSFPVDVLQKG
jgi:uncharacterized protein YodC (DUF2158 family)